MLYESYLDISIMTSVWFISRMQSLKSSCRVGHYKLYSALMGNLDLSCSHSNLYRKAHCRSSTLYIFIYRLWNDIINFNSVWPLSEQPVESNFLTVIISMIYTFVLLFKAVYTVHIFYSWHITTCILFILLISSTLWISFFICHIYNFYLLDFFKLVYILYIDVYCCLQQEYEGNAISTLCMSCTCDNKVNTL